MANKVLESYLARIRAGEQLQRLQLSDQDLTNDEVAELMSELAKSPAAKTIRVILLRFNKITHIDIPKELVALQELDLGYNQLQAIDIPKELVALQELYLENNELTHLDIPKELVSLKELSLSYNQLLYIQLPKELVSLRELSLNNNLLWHIHIPKELISLRRLYLSNNKLRHIDVARQLVALTELDLRHNRIMYISVPMELARLKQLNIRGNLLTHIRIPRQLMRSLHIENLFGNPYTRVTLGLLRTTGINIPEVSQFRIDAEALKEHFKRIPCELKTAIQSYSTKEQGHMLFKILEQLILVVEVRLSDRSPQANMTAEVNTKALLMGNLADWLPGQEMLINPRDELNYIRSMLAPQEGVVQPAFIAGWLNEVNTFATQEDKMLKEMQTKYDMYEASRVGFVARAIQYIEIILKPDVDKSDKVTAIQKLHQLFVDHGFEEGLFGPAGKIRYKYEFLFRSAIGRAAKTQQDGIRATKAVPPDIAPKIITSSAPHTRKR